MNPNLDPHTLNSKKGFTLIEIMITIMLFLLISGFLVGLMMMATRVQYKETADIEVGSQLSFIMQTIQRLIRESTAVSVNSDSQTLTLTIPDAARNPTRIALNNGGIDIKEGSGATTTLTTAKVSAEHLVFTRFTNPPASDVVKILIVLRYATANPFASTTRTLQSSAGLLY